MSHSVAASAVFAVTQWAVIVAVAQFGDPRQVGLLTLAGALVTPVFAFSSLSLREARTVDIGDRFSVADYIALRATTTVIATLVCALIVGIGYGVEPQDFVFTMFAFVTARVVHGQTNLNYGIFQRAGRFDLVAKSSYIRSVAGLASFVLVFYWSRSLGAAYLAQAAAWASAFVLYESARLAELGQPSRWAALRQSRPGSVWRLFVWMSPLGLAGAFQALTAAAPRFALSLEVDMQTLGYFGAIAYFQAASQIITTAVGQAAAIRLSRLYHAREMRRFVVLSGKLLVVNGAMAIVIMLLAWLLGIKVVTVLYGADYADFGLILQVAGTVALAFVTSVFQVGLSSGHFFGSRLITNSMTFALSAVLSIMFIPAYGIHGAGWVLLGGAVFRLIVSALAWAACLTSPPKSP